MQLSGNKSLLIPLIPACGSGMCALECAHISHCALEHVGSTSSKGAWLYNADEGEAEVLQNSEESKSWRNFYGQVSHQHAVRVFFFIIFFDSCVFCLRNVSCL